MSDFHQSGVITTLHKLGPPNLETLETELERTAAVHPVARVPVRDHGQDPDSISRHPRQRERLPHHLPDRESS